MSTFLFSLASVLAASAEEYDYHTVLQTDSSLFSKESLEVAVSCRVRAIRHFDTTDYVFSKVTVTLLSRRYGYGANNILHTFSDKAIYKASDLTTTVPLWGGQYIPSKDFVLPTARLYKVGGKVYYVLLDGTEVITHRVTADPADKTRIAEVPISEMPSLQSLWKSSFSPHDIYWCYRLVTKTRHFGLAEDGIVDHKQFVDTAYLDKVYTSLMP